MFFKSRVERDIDDYKAKQEREQRPVHTGNREQHRLTTQASSATVYAVARKTPDARDRVNTEAAREPESALSEHKQSVVSPNATWEGRLTTEGSAWLEGEMSGEVEAGETVYIAKGAKVRANINARRAIIGGDMEGHITCREQLVVERSGCLAGKVSTRTLVVEDGAVVRSEIHMIREEDSSQNSGKAERVAPRQASAAVAALAWNQRQQVGQVNQPSSSIQEGR